MVNLWDAHSSKTNKELVQPAGTSYIVFGVVYSWLTIWCLATPRPAISNQGDQKKGKPCFQKFQDYSSSPEPRAKSNRGLLRRFPGTIRGRPRKTFPDMEIRRKKDPFPHRHASGEVFWRRSNLYQKRNSATLFATSYCLFFPEACSSNGCQPGQDACMCPLLLTPPKRRGGVLF